MCAFTRGNRGMHHPYERGCVPLIKRTKNPRGNEKSGLVDGETMTI